jgi:hypothetical protein
MASIRLLKSEINYLTFEIISDCNTFMSLHPEKKDDTMALIEKAVELRNNCILKINQAKNENHSYYADIRKTLIKEADKIFSQLRELIK